MLCPTNTSTISEKIYLIWGFLGGASGKEPACQGRRCEFDPWVRDRLGESMAPHSSIFAWRIPWTEEPGGWIMVHRVAKSQTLLKWLSTAQHRTQLSWKCLIEMDLWFLILLVFETWNYSQRNNLHHWNIEPKNICFTSYLFVAKMISEGS